MDLKQLYLTRQSTREFSDEEVTDEQLKEICELATLAPSAINGQPYRLYAINGEKAKQFAVNIQIGGANKWANSVKAFIAICQTEPFSVDRGTRVISNEKFIANDIGILAAYLTLAAENTGVQSCIVGLCDSDGIAKFLNLPSGTHFPLVIALGHKPEGYPVRQKQRKPFDEVYKLIK